MAAYFECTFSKLLTFFYFGLCSVLLNDVEKHSVLFLARYYYDILKVFGSGTYERYSAYVNLLDDVGL